MSIRVAGEIDAAAVVALWRSCELVVSHNDPSSDFREAVSGPCSDVLLNENELGQLDGTVMVGYDGHRGWLYYVAAAPHAQGKGIGRKMVEAAEQWLRDRGQSTASRSRNKCGSGEILRAPGIRGGSAYCYGQVVEAIMPVLLQPDADFTNG
jgi:GNAT superfamily N-acetyltransferase